MEHRKIYSVAALSLASLFLSASVTWAQIDLGNFTISGEAEVGGMPRHKNGSAAKFEEYRDVPETVIVPQLQLMIGGKKNDFYLDFDSTKVGRDDQNYRLRFGRYGLLDIEFEWDQIPHTFNVDTAQTPFARDGGTYTLSSKPVQSNPLRNPTGTAFQTYLTDPTVMHDVDLKLLYGIARVKIRYTPTPGWSLSGSYWSQNTTGKRAFGTIIGPSPGGNVVELPEPIDYQSHNIELGGEYAGKGWSVGLKYNGSLFHNNISTLVWDNPNNATGVGSNCRDSALYDATGTRTNTFGTTDGVVYNNLFGPCKGRLDLYPSNQAHTFTLSGTARLPLKTHFMGTVSYGWRTQNDKFLPFTINSCFGSGAVPASCRDSSLIPLPTIDRSSLDGDVRPLMINATLVNRFFDRLDLKAYYRFYDLDNRSKRVFFEEGVVINDQAGNPGIEPGERCIPGAGGTVECPELEFKTFPWAYSKQNVGFDASYRVTRWLTAKLGYVWENMHRERREVLDSNEHIFGPSFDIKPNSWVLIRASYKRSLRDAHEYDTGRYAVVETEETQEEVRNALLGDLRKFEEAARNRDQFSLFTQLTPLANLTLYGGFDFKNERYPRTVIGIKNDIDYVPSVGFVYAPVDWLSLFGDYNWERFDWKMKAMQRSSPLSGGNDETPANRPDRVWTSRGKDQIHTIKFGTDLRLIKDLLGLRLQYGFSEGVTQVHASGNSGGTEATDYPTIRNAWHEFLARLEYQLHKNVGLNVGYYYNSYSSRDFGVDIMKPWMGDVDTGGGQQRSAYLGDRLKGNYNAHVGFFGLRLKF